MFDCVSGLYLLMLIDIFPSSQHSTLQDVVTESEFERKLLTDVIPPSDIGVTFDDIGALENVKDTLKELVMLPLQRPELFSKGQLAKVSGLNLQFLFNATFIFFPRFPRLFAHKHFLAAALQRNFALWTTWYR